jgi:Na+-driven multidrug efflux pump
MLTAPILPMRVRLSLPNMMAMLAMALVTIAETAYVGRLGTPPLAGLALVFSLVMLQQMLSGGAMGGGVSSAISRALGAGGRPLLHFTPFSSVGCAVSPPVHALVGTLGR